MPSLSPPISAAASTARSASTTAAAPSTRPTLRTTARCRSASSSRTSVEDVIATVATCRRTARRFSPAAAAPASPGSAATSPWSSISQVHAPGARDRPGRRLARVQPGTCSTTSATQAERHGPHLRARPRDPQPLHARRDDRQQLLRRPLGDGGQDGRQRRRARHPHLRRPAAPGGRGPATRSCARIIHGGGRRGEIYARLKALRDRYADRIRERFPKIPRRVSGYNLDQLLPENGFHVARALVGTEGTCVTVLEADVRLVPSPPARTLVVLGYPDVFAAARPCAGVLAHGPIGLEGIDDRLVEAIEAQRAACRRASSSCRQGGAGCCRVRRRHPGGGRRQGARPDGGAPQAERRADDEALRRPEQEQRIWKVRESGLGRDRARARAAGQLGGLGRLGGAAGAARRLPARPPQAVRQVRLRRRPLRPLRAGLRPHAHRLRPATRRRASRKFRAFVDEAADLVVSLRRLALGRARRRPGARRAAAEDVRRGAGRSLPASSSRSGTRSGR